MCHVECGDIKVMEVFSPERVVPIATEAGMTGCGSFDIRIRDPGDGKSWDFNKADRRSKLWEIIKKEKPTVIIGSPECNPFSILHRLQPTQRNTEQYRSKLKEGIEHM